MKIYAYSVLALIVGFVSMTESVLGATSYFIGNTSQIGKTVTLTWTGTYPLGTNASIILEGPSSCSTDSNGSVSICTMDIRRTIVATVAASAGRYEFYLDPISPRALLGKRVLVEIGGSQVFFNVSSGGTSSVSKPVDTIVVQPVAVGAPVSPFSVSVTPQRVTAGNAAIISWTGEYSSGTVASITFQKPSTCNKAGIGDALLCTRDIRYVTVGNSLAALKSFRWDTIGSSKDTLGTVVVTIGGVTGTASLRIDATSDTTQGITATPSVTAPFSVTCSKTGESNSASFYASFNGGSYPYTSVWLDNGLEVPSLDSIKTSGYHKVTIRATDSRGRTTLSECGSVTIEGGQTTVSPVSTSDVTSSTCVDLSSNLRRGMRGVSVSLLQKYLKSAGFLTEEASGYFGVVTEAAIKKFQTSNSIESTGIVGAITRAKVKSLSCR